MLPAHLPRVEQMREELRGGRSLILTADVPNLARNVGLGPIALARATGRPLVPFAGVTTAPLELDNWDRARIALPFGRACVFWSEPIHVPQGAKPAEIEAVRSREARSEQPPLPRPAAAAPTACALVLNAVL